MAVEFNLDIDKVIATAIFIASKDVKDVPDLTMAKLLKLIFLADKYHLVRYGRPITGDCYVAMKDGPVPSFTYDIFKKEVLKTPFTVQGKRLARAFRKTGPTGQPVLRAVANYDPNQLSRSDVAALDTTIREFGRRSFSQLRKITHDMNAWKESWESRGDKDRAAMYFEQIFADDPNAIAGDMAEMIENDRLRHLLAQP